MHDPFKIDSRTAISVSGGRTSGLMLWRVLQSNGGKLPPDALAMFANTGKEEEATLRFVRDMQEHWSVPINWIEYRAEAPGFALVDFETASRNGEPFAALIEKDRYLPNALRRLCTSRLKVRVQHKYFKTLGWHDDDGWDQMIGLRADEERRLAKIRNRGRSSEIKAESMVMPLAEAGLTRTDVDDFWASQPFKLELTVDAKGNTTAGNCDLCFLKPLARIVSLVKERPERAVWWAAMESYAQTNFADKRSDESYKFRNDRPSYSQIAAFAKEQRDMFDQDEEAIACFCGD